MSTVANGSPVERDGRMVTGMNSGAVKGLTTSSPSAENSYFLNGPAVEGQTNNNPNGIQSNLATYGSSSSAASPNSTVSLVAPKTTDHLSAPNSQPNTSRFSSPLPLPASSGTHVGQPQQPPPPGSSLRHRHTLQVPKAHNSRNSAPGGMSDAVASGRFSPTAGAPRRASISLGRRATRSVNSDMHIDEIPQDEDAARWAEAIKAKRASKRRKQEEEEDDKVVVGTKVDHNHVNWVTAYNMLTGIRFVVSRVNAKMDKPLTDADFDAKHKFSFDITGNELTPSAKYDFKFKDYSPWVFRHLRSKFGLDPADYLMSLTSKYILSELGSPGKSGSFFYFSRDYKYIIKTIHHGEHLFLRKILRDYWKHVEDNPDTLISQFYGLHRVKTPFGRKIHFVVMNNLFPPHRDIHQTFDLKGSTIGRDFKEENLADNPRATLKDLNWLRRDMNLNFGPHKKELFLQQVERDVKLLQKLHIMDYSLLLGIHDLTRGNRDDIRNNALKVFQPGGSESDDLHGHMLQRTPSKMEKARQARELRKIINKEVPVSLDRTSNRLPDEFLEQRKTVFYGDDGGFRATHESDEPGDVIYYLGIIDCLTHYGFAKKAEHFWRGLSNPKDQVSAIPPQGYGDRFFKFISGLVKSPEEAARDKEMREKANAEAVPAQSENDVVDRAHDQAERTGVNEGDRPSRSLGTVRSPSAERTGGATGAVLPVVEEAGEGSSTGARSRSRNGSVSDGGRHSGYFDSVTDRRPSRETASSPVALERPRPQLDNGTVLHQPLKLQTGSIVQKHEQDDFAIRVARVSS
ncbi:SAICAR synthase-like protein [Choiromyces venosus 120613-1]|uniref:1-phosphatidylinositol-4-phosphate 5-kinase n=1 Tax=Choiromyces venosus 120613-1 TaxID=1336337 RepID=A0A3N4IY65_9PEZI|nr:SAICAR synthase-like protein [Choiromyces venosus 120613-1]